LPALAVVVVVPVLVKLRALDRLAVVQDRQQLRRLPQAQQTRVAVVVVLVRTLRAVLAVPVLSYSLCPRKRPQPSALA
jgi:uncharacterized membrane protein YdjX (TVP38/TMEM64 family)